MKTTKFMTIPQGQRVAAELIRREVRFEVTYTFGSNEVVITSPQDQEFATVLLYEGVITSAQYDVFMDRK